MKFDIITIFPDIIREYFSEGVIARANEAGIISIRGHNVRDWTEDRHKTVDAPPFGGGPGMVMKIEPLYRAVQEFKTQNPKSKIILTSPRGKPFTQKKAKEYSVLDQLIIICGRYEGIDERVSTHVADEVISIGDYVLSGGEIAALAIVEATARLIPGVLGNEESPDHDLFPEYTRPEVFITDDGKKLRVPKILLSGNHKLIDEWRKRKTKKKLDKYF